MNKCEWKEGKFYPCEGLTKNRHYVTDSGCLVNDQNFTTSYTHCPFCGADIRKPKPGVIIKQSGGTWVARYDGMDYLVLDPRVFGLVGRMVEVEELIEKSIIKPISEVEITDEIAKLRPMVVSNVGIRKLVYVDGGWGETDNCNGLATSEIRLATVADLEEV